MEKEEEKLKEEKIEEEKDTEAPIITKIIDVDDLSDSFSETEVNKNIKYAILSYIGFLFLIPILKNIHKKSKYVLFHINQGFNIFMLNIFVFIVLRLLNSMFINTIAYTPWWISVVNFVSYTIVVLLSLFGIINSINGKSKELPIIGKYRFIK